MRASCDAHYRVRAPSLHLRFHPSVLTFIDSHMITCWVKTCSVKIGVTTTTAREITFNWQLCLRAKMGNRLVYIQNFTCFLGYHYP